MVIHLVIKILFHLYVGYLLINHIIYKLYVEINKNFNFYSDTRFFIFKYASCLQNEIVQLVVNNPNFLYDNAEMNNLVESVRYGLKSLLNNEDYVLNHDLFNNLLQVKSFYSNRINISVES